MMECAARDTHVAHVKDELDRHERAHLAHHDTVKEILANQIAAREQHLQSIENLLKREKAEHLAHHGTCGGRIDLVEHSVGLLDEIVRKERAEHKAELGRIWDAIDKRTHDLIPSITKRGEGGYGGEPSQFTRVPSPSLCQAPANVTRILAPVAPRSASPPLMRSAATPPAMKRKIHVNSPVASSPTSVVSLMSTLSSSTPSLNSRSTIPLVKTISAYDALGVRQACCERPVQEVVRAHEAEQRHLSHATETITCGQTRYGGQAQTSAHIPLGGTDF